MKRNTDALESQIEASARFNPLALTEFLERRDGVVCVDRTKILHNDDDERLFIIILARDYRSGYRDINVTTVYFDVDGNNIIGGIYDTVAGRKVNRRVIASPSFDPMNRYRYVYNEDTINLIRDRILAAT